jgi:hypothetical protein
VDDGEAVDLLADNGLPRVAATGVIDVLRAESGLDPKAVNPREGATGIAQWTAGRRAAMLAFAAARHEPWDTLKPQLLFLLHELKTDELGTYRALQLADSVDEAIEIFVAKFERPESDAEVDKRAEAEAGQAFGPSVTEGSAGIERRLTGGNIAPAEVQGTQQTTAHYDYSNKVKATGKRASERGSTIQSIATQLGRLPARFRR